MDFVGSGDSCWDWQEVEGKDLGNLISHLNANFVSLKNLKHGERTKSPYYPRGSWRSLMLWKHTEAFFRKI